MIWFKINENKPETQFTQNVKFKLKHIFKTRKQKINKQKVRFSFLQITEKFLQISYFRKHS